MLREQLKSANQVAYIGFIMPSTYLLDVMTETLAMLALLLAIMHYYRRSTVLSICHGVARLISPKQAMRGSRYPYLPLLPKR